MSTTLVPLQQYLDTSYSPDREYVDGVLVERHVGRRPHSRVQGNLAYFLQQRYPALFVWPEQRVRTSARRVRIPDICVTHEDPGTDVFEAPPFLCIEILSPEDSLRDVIVKRKEYEALGVQYNWLVDPLRKEAFVYSTGRLEEVTGPDLVAGDISIPLSEVFDRL